MFKSDEKSLEMMSLDFSEKEILTYFKLFDYLKNNSNTNLSLEEITKDLDILKRIQELQTTNSFYAFGVHDTYSQRIGASYIGVNLYKRIGSLLKPVVCSMGDDVTNEFDVLRYMKRNKISKVYTGNFLNFLNLKSCIDIGDGDEISLSVLVQDQIDIFKKDNVIVTYLEELI